MQSPTEGAIYADYHSGELYRCTDSPRTAGVPTHEAEYMTVTFEKVGDGEYQDHGEVWTDEVGRVKDWEYVADEVDESALELIQSADEGDEVKVEYYSDYGDNPIKDGEVVEVEDGEIWFESDGGDRYCLDVRGVVSLESSVGRSRKNELADLVSGQIL